MRGYQGTLRREGPRTHANAPATERWKLPQTPEYYLSMTDTSVTVIVYLYFTLTMMWYITLVNTLFADLGFWVVSNSFWGADFKYVIRFLQTRRVFILF